MNRILKPALLLGGPVLLAAGCYGLAPYYTTIAVWELRPILPVALAVAVGLAIAAGLGSLGARLDEYDNRPMIGLGLAGCLIGAIVAVGWITHTQYQQDRTLAGTLTVTTTPVPDLAGRTPFQVAQAQARSALPDGGDIVSDAHLPDQGRHATLVTRRGMLAGYATVLTTPATGDGQGPAGRCEFDHHRADARAGGLFGHNLGRQISTHQRWVRFTADDIYAYCDHDRPIVVVPLKRQSGILVVTEKPAGVALYDGKTGELTITTDTTGVPGPSYPLSLAAQQRDATTATGSFTDWLFRRAGWELPDDDVNSANTAEYTLTTDGRPTYVTPMTARGSATAISAITTVPARHSGLRLAPLTVHRLDPTWVSPTAIADRIRADYQDLPNWHTITVYEIIPTGRDRWTATLGTGQTILYRATGVGTLTGDTPTCLHHTDGSILRCGSTANTHGNGPGLHYAPNSTPRPGEGHPTPSSAPNDRDLNRMTDQQLADLHRRIADETACRLQHTCHR
ncbi:hypothetical protein AWW66_09895 [Micromonospora rosaria]|uniref:Uncharacterized protein n=1 Tax=Micromonospora rosaria TaxID=47874 RepID=A0A136PUN8_9ACTN|nr:hypothetical protein [Micromonospora rosaria]KXK62142.1 hypothetical protein AWW66_09895 [Micromonospora rosaria]